MVVFVADAGPGCRSSSPRPSCENIDDLLRSLHDWHADHRPFTITGSHVTKLISTSTPGSCNWDLQRQLTMPPEELVARRLQTLVIAVMGQLEATANSDRIMGELLHGGAPSTALGEQETAFVGPATPAHSPG